METADASVLIDQYVHRFSLDAFLKPALLTNLRLFRFAASDTVLMEQEKVRFLYFQVEGRLRCAHYHSNGALAVVGLTSPLTAIGDVEFLKDQPAGTAVVAVEDSVLLGLPREKLIQEAWDDPQLLRFLLDQLSSKIRESTALRLAHVLPMKARLALYLLSLRKDEENPVVVVPDKENFASMLGATPRHLSRVLRELVDEGILGGGYPGIRIKNPGALGRLVC